MAESQIGVLIDFENVGLNSIQSLFDQLSDVGRIIVKRAYGDWSKAQNVSDQLLSLGIEARQVFRSAGSGKNAADISLAIDAIDMMHRNPGLDTYVIVSSDTDFVPLVSTLRGAGKTVIGAGHIGVVSRALVNSCDRYMSLSDGKKADMDTSALKQETDSLLVRAMEASLDDHGLVVAAKLHNTMLRMDPSFDYKTMGHRSFSGFLNGSSQVKVHRSRGRGGDVFVELTATASSGASQQDASGNGIGRDQEEKIDEAWSQVPGETIAGSKAASEAAKALGVSKLSSSRYKSLQGLLNASERLRSRWTRVKNSILKN